MAANNVLGELLRQGAPQRAIDAVERLTDAVASITQQRFNQERTGEEIRAARAACLAELRAALVEAETRIDGECRDELEAWDRARLTRAAEKFDLPSVVDVHELRTSEDPAEVLALVDHAMAASPETGEAARVIAERRMRVLAGVEQKRNQLSGPAFRALCALSTRRRAVSRQDIIERARRAKRGAMTLVKQVAQCVALDAELQRAVVVASTPAPTTKSTMTFGSYWERIEQGKR